MKLFWLEAQKLKGHTGSFFWKVSTGAVGWSDETFRIFGYDRTAKPTAWSSPSSGIHPGRRDPDEARHSSARRGEVMLSNVNVSFC